MTSAADVLLLETAFVVVVAEAPVGALVPVKKYQFIYSSDPRNSVHTWGN
jgi:hypothetical protein